MKRIITLSLIIAGCSASQNDKMNKLLSNKKNYEDSTRYYKNKNTFYNDLYQQEDNNIIKRKLFLDTSVMYFMLKLKSEIKIDQIKYSIDSLSKLK